MIFLRVYDGIANHFPIRRMEWLMAVPAVAMSIALQVQPDMFEVSPSFEALKGWANEETWAWACLALALARLMALTINGTFQSFRWSPAIRAGASVVGALLWANVTAGFAASYLFDGGAASAVIAWATLSLAECLNVYQTWGDLGKSLQGADDA